MGCGSSTGGRAPEIIFTGTPKCGQVSLPHYDLEERLQDYYVDVEAKRKNPTRMFDAGQVLTYKVLLTGLEESGKSHLLYTLMQGPEPAVEPAETDTVVEETLYVTPGTKFAPRVNFHIFDMGGQKHVREKYIDETMRGCFGIIFAVDLTSNQEQLEDARGWLAEVVTNEDSFHMGVPKPILILGTKSDQQHILSIQDLERCLVAPLFTGENAKRKYSVVTTTISNEPGHVRAAMGLQHLSNHMRDIHMALRHE